MAAPLVARDVWSTVNYQLPTVDPAYMYATTPPPGTPKTNIVDDPRPILVRDLRGKEETRTLDGAGFQYLEHPTTLKDADFFSDEEIRKVYYPECEELVKKLTGAKRTFVFDHTVRRGDGGKPGIRGPAKRVHVDQSFPAAISRAHLHLPTDAPRLLQSRFRIINVWRPLSHPVAHWPLACCDFSSIDSSKDLIFTRHIYPDREGSNWGVSWNEQHRWYFLSDQKPDEVILIKCFDSEEKEGVARCTPHTAFEDSGSPGEAPKRESIEVRLLVFDDE